MKNLPLIYTRYILPLFSDLLFIIFAFIPCVTYTLDGEAKEKISLLQLMSNSWQNSRHYLFSAKSSAEPEGIAFYKSLFTVLIVLSLLFLLLIAIDIFTVSAFASEMRAQDKKCKLLFVTLIPNRIVLNLIRLILLPIAFFPNIVTHLYRTVLIYPVTMRYSLPLWILALSLWLICSVMCIVSRAAEKSADLDVFAISTTEEKSHAPDENKNEPSSQKARRVGNNSSKGELGSIRGLFSDDNEKSDND